MGCDERCFCDICSSRCASTQKLLNKNGRDVEVCKQCYNKIYKFFTVLLCTKKLGINVYKDLKICLYNTLMES